MEIKKTLEHHMCAVCGIDFAAPKEYVDGRRKDPKKNFHCPNGHSLGWFDNRTDEQLREEIKKLTAQNEELSTKIKGYQTENVALRSQLDQLEAKFENLPKQES